MFEQVQSQRFYLQIVNQIRQLIADGKLKAGDKLPPERVLAQEFGASRACIREALSALETLGLIECKSGQGNFIKADGGEASVDGEVLKELLRSHSPYEVFEARVEIEPSMAALAAERGTPEDIAKLGEHLERLNALGREAEQDPSKIEDYMEEDRKFHLEIARAAHNSVLFTVSAGVNLMMKEKHWRVLKRKSIEKEGNIRKFEAEHTAIFNAIRDRNPELARIEARTHTEAIEKDLFEG